MNNTAAFDLCVCKHTRAAHDDDGCIICQSIGQRCDGFWSQQEYNDAVQSALVNIAAADKQRHTDANPKVP